MTPEQAADYKAAQDAVRARLAAVEPREPERDDSVWGDYEDRVYFHYSPEWRE